MATRAYSGPADFWTNGYTLNFALAQNIAAGLGYTFNGQPTTFRAPLYPLLLAATTRGTHAFWSVVLTQSVIGGATVVGVGLLAAELFGSATVSILAACIVAAYPYYVIHDTALQETSLFTLLVLASTIALIRAQRSGSVGSSATAGVLLGLTLLVRSTLAPFAVVAPALLLAFGKGTRSARLAVAVVSATILIAVLSPWLLRSYHLTGSPVLVSETGRVLWAGNNAATFRHYPRESIDVSTVEADEALTEQDLAEIQARGDNEVPVDRWFLSRALEYMQAHPAQTVWNAGRKIAAAFSWVPNPRRGLWRTLAHACSYGPVMALGLYGMFLTRSAWREHVFIYANLLSFILVTGIFFGHTSHRSYLDVYLIVYAAHALLQLWSSAARRFWPSRGTPLRPHATRS